MTGKGRILAVDDTSASLKLLTELLNEQGYDVRSAISGELALHAAASSPPDLVLLDIRMPEMDGYEICRRLKADPATRNIPVIFVSAATETDEKVRGFELGAVDFVTKPFQRDELLARVRTHLELNRLRHHLEDMIQERAAELQESQARYKRIIEGLTDYQYTVRIENGRAVDTAQSPACLTVTGYTAEEFSANPALWIQMVAAEDRKAVLEHVDHIMAGHDVPPVEHRIVRKDGETRWVSDTSILFRDASGKLLSYDGVIKDITERKQAEAEIAHTNRALATLGMANHQLVYATDETELLQAICQAITEQRGYRMASVGYTQPDAQQTIKIMAHAGCDGDYYKTAEISWAEGAPDIGPIGRAMRSGTTQLCQDIASSYSQPWRDAALQRGYAASIALPLTDSGKKVFGVLTVYSEEVNAFSTAEVDLLEKMAGDLAYGVRALRTRKERDLAMEQSQRYLTQLQGSLEDTVQAISRMVELRDPYTAGHQSRVAVLAAAIAGQLGLPAEQAHAVYLAGIVHDLGKIQIPSEILSKPGKISDIEFNLIKTHAQAGYDILKAISFPWPIAQMVLQHHEHLDGTGYPQGLKGDVIMLEARIICVADVVEAMSSHRPYRAALGTESALAEISKQRGICFDPQVVDACLSLFKNKHFSFPP